MQIYKKAVHENVDHRKYDKVTGEILGMGNWEDNPFTGHKELLHQLGDPEENLQKSFSRTKNKIYDIVRSNTWDWFVTFTFNKEKVDRYDYSEVTKKLSQWLNNMRRICPGMKYVVVPEQHEDGAWHFHGLFWNCDGLQFVDSGKKDKEGRKIYNVWKYRYGFTTATEIGHVGRASSYLLKYVTKELCDVSFGKKRYWASKNCDMPVVETYMITSSEIDLVEMYIDELEYMKQVKNAYNEVTYLELPIYTTNTNFSKRYRLFLYFIV